MKFLEKELEEIIFNASLEELNEKGLPLSGKCYRQLNLGNYGIADLVYVKKYYHDIGEPYLCITVCELKKEKAGISAFLQAVRYVKGISRYLYKRGMFNYVFEIFLIAPEIDTSSDFIYLTDLIANEHYCTILSSADNYSVQYDVNGISFQREWGYKLTNEGF